MSEPKDLVTHELEALREQMVQYALPLQQINKAIAIHAIEREAVEYVRQLVASGHGREHAQDILRRLSELEKT